MPDWLFELDGRIALDFEAVAVSLLACLPDSSRIASGSVSCAA